MKAKLILLTTAIITFFQYSFSQQLSDPDFTNWTTDSLAPVGWATYASDFGVSFGDSIGRSVGLSFKDSTAGDYVTAPNSIKLVSDTVPGQPGIGVIAGIVSTGTGNASGGAPQFEGIAFPFRPDTLNFDYKYSSPTTDSAFVSIMLKAGTDTMLFGGQTLPPASEWTSYSLIITAAYADTVKPDSLLLQFFSSAALAPVQGGTLLLDNVRFGYVNYPTTAINQVKAALNATLYPNPAKNQITITANQDLTGCTAEIYDLAGQIVLSRIIDNATAVINIATLANGMYVYRITDPQHNAVLQNKFVVTK